MEDPILFYDGECGLCARTVQWALAHDRRERLRFAPLQGATFAALPVAWKPTDLSTAVLLDADGLHVESAAILRLFVHLGGPWALLGRLGRLVPDFVRDPAYRFVARRRHALGRTGDHCRLPAAADRRRFLS